MNVVFTEAPALKADSHYDHRARLRRGEVAQAGHPAVPRSRVRSVRVALDPETNGEHLDTDYGERLRPKDH